MHEQGDELDKSELQENTAGIQVTIESGGIVQSKGNNGNNIEHRGWDSCIPKKNLVLYDSRNDDPQKITA